MPSNDPLAMRKPDKDDPPSLHMRRLRDAPFDTLQRLIDEFGHRPATSLAEARAAALLDGRLRRAGLQVIADTFSAIPEPGWVGMILGLLACGALLAYYWLPLLTLGLAAVLALLATIALLRPRFLSGMPRPSQNVVGNRAASDQQHYRLVLLARIDTPLAPAILTRALGGQHIMRMRLVATLVFGLLAIIGLFDPQRLWLYLLALPALYLAAAALHDVLAARPLGATHPKDSAGIAVLLAASEQLDALEHTELWAIGLGATARGAGLSDVLRRYPFDSAKTLFVALEGLGSGAPAIVSTEGWPRSLPADPQLAEALATITQDPQDSALSIASPTPTLASTLLQDGRRAISIACFGPQSETVPDMEQEHLERATRIVIALARAIDQWG